MLQRANSLICYCQAASSAFGQSQDQRPAAVRRWLEGDELRLPEPFDGLTHGLLGDVAVPCQLRRGGFVPALQHDQGVVLGLGQAAVENCSILSVLAGLGC